MRNHTAEEVRAAAEQRDDAGKTALHFACQNAPPPDVIDVFLSIAVNIVQWPDSFGWLPIHYACAFGADTQVIKSLAEAFPESKTTVDRKGRTPLHFALGTSNSNSSAVVVLLSSMGAASYADDNGMLVSRLID
jgi:ankyrin repeat protein